MSEPQDQRDDAHDQDAEPGSAPSGAAAQTNTAEEQDPDAGPASAPVQE
jgi:hypothetical protein